VCNGQTNMSSTELPFPHDRGLRDNGAVAGHPILPWGSSNIPESTEILGALNRPHSINSYCTSSRVGPAFAIQLASYNEKFLAVLQNIPYLLIQADVDIDRPAFAGRNHINETIHHRLSGEW
jgi:hypothetical protein